jgi:hypothetical protein
VTTTSSDDLPLSRLFSAAKPSSGEVERLGPGSGVWLKVEVEVCVEAEVDDEGAGGYGKVVQMSQMDEVVVSSVVAHFLVFRSS